jgi:hypothetical protein
MAVSEFNTIAVVPEQVFPPVKPELVISLIGDDPKLVRDLFTWLELKDPSQRVSKFDPLNSSSIRRYIEKQRRLPPKSSLSEWADGRPQTDSKQLIEDTFWYLNQFPTEVVLLPGMERNSILDLMLENRYAPNYIRLISEGDQINKGIRVEDYRQKKPAQVYLSSSRESYPAMVKAAAQHLL